jgi:signal transduction histidine kinase
MKPVIYLNRTSSLRKAAVMFVLSVMLASSVLTTVSFFILRGLGLIPGAFAVTLWMPVVTLVISTVLGTLLATMISKMLTQPLSDLVNATTLVARGNFDVRVEETEEIGELADLQKSFNSMTKELGSIEMFREDFINTFSHEFKTPIVSVLGFARQLRKEVPDGSREAEYADIIISESERLARLSSNVLLMTKFETQEIIGEKTDFSLDEQIRNCILLLEKQWSAKNIEWDIDLDPVNYNGNAEMMSQLWINLLGNAVKYSNDGGKIEVRLGIRNGVPVFRLRDEGCGMDEETMKHIFDKFYKGDRSHSTEGNGIGLSIVKRIIELCGGGISVESEPGKGSVFTVRL